MNDLWDPQPERIAVFRALQLGDLLVAVPALRALRAAAPQARITLIGLPWAESFVRRFRHLVDDFLPFSGFPGFAEREADAAALTEFLAQARKRRFQLAIQLHGSGATTNSVVSLMGARRCAGFFPADKPWRPRHLFLPWPEHGHEIHRCLRLMQLLGAPLLGDHLEFPLTEQDRAGWAAIAARHRLADRGYVCIHPGSRMPSRRWPAERFADVARHLAAFGWPVVVTGGPDERAIAAPVLQALGGSGIDLVGATGLGELGACLAGARLLVCNDTGVSHVACGVGTPSVIISSGADVSRWAPLDHRLHRTLWQPAACRPCAHAVCPVAGHPCATGVPVQAVTAEIHRLLDTDLEAAA
jgi:ADP-heptose:LPS heptosyltransferase